MSQDTSGFIYGNFRPFVDTQIKVRQRFLSQLERSPENILYLTGKTSWVKMTSAVDFTEDSFLAKQYNLYGPEIAKQYQLFGGTLWKQKTSEGKEIDTLRYGIGASRNKGIQSNNNYGLGGITEAGFRPMPGIESVSIKSKNAFGSLKEATINFKCWNLEQLNVLEALYMRPGYQVLLEWGHTIYYNNENPSKLITGKKIKYLDFFSPKLDSPQKVLNQIEIFKKDSGGNYDAILGIVKNFTFTANTDGSYNCVTVLTTWGEIVESLKINSAPLSSLNVFNTPGVETNNSSNTTDVSQSINTSKTQLEEYLRSLNIIANSTGVNEALLQNATSFVSSVDTISPYYQLSPNEDFGSFNATPKEFELITKNEAPGLYAIPFINNDSKTEKITYIPLARLLLAMNSINGIYGAKDTSILPINYDITHNKALTSPIQFSVDPGVCYYIASYDKLTNPVGETAASFTQNYESALPIRVSTQIMNFMALPISTNYIIETLNSCQNKETSEIDLLTFLKKLMEGINFALGNYNKFDVSVENNTVFIIDKQYLPLNYSPSPSKIRVSGTRNSQTGEINFGFCRSYNFSSRITNKIGAEIAISAQANASALNMDNVSFSRLNRGMKDRINPYIKDFTQKSQSIFPNDSSELIARGFIVLKDYYEKITKQQPSFTKEDVLKSQNFLKDILNRTKSKAEEGTTFIPIDINLTIDGIAGIRLGECFEIESEKLPANYKDKLGNAKIKFLVRSLNQNINNNVWTTDISALSVINSVPKSSESFTTSIDSLIIEDTIQRLKREEEREKEAQQWRENNAQEIQEFNQNKQDRENQVTLLDAQIQTVRNQINSAQDADVSNLQSQLNALIKQRNELANPYTTVTLPDGSTSTPIPKDSPVFKIMQQNP